MPRFYRPYICQTIGEFNDKLGWMMLHAPKFTDPTGYIVDRNIDTVFKGFNESIDNLRPKLGAERHAAMREMSDRARVLFETEPDNAENTKEGRQIIYEMELMLRRKRAAPQ